MPPTFIPRYCATHQKEIVFVLQKSRQYTKYAFDSKIGEFRAVVCNCCHLEATERQLHPIYAVWSHKLRRYVIFAQNVLTGRIEQFVYNRTSESFEEVRRPELQFNGAHYERRTNVLFSVGGDSEEADSVTVIRKDDVVGSFRKERFNSETGRFEVIPARPVKFLRKKEEPPVKIYVPMAAIKRILKARAPPTILVPRPPKAQKESVHSDIQKVQKSRKFFSKSLKSSSDEIPKKFEREELKVYSEEIYEDEV